MSVKMALIGNPNSGKTTLFNLLTGSTQYVGNWPGVTVEKKEGRLIGRKDVVVVDLPGIYSLSPYTLEEVITRDYLIQDRPDVIINILDATNLERNLYLTTQLTEIGIPVVAALNMMDVVEKSGDRLDAAALSRELGMDVVEISAQKGGGVREVVQKALLAVKEGKAPSLPPIFSSGVTTAIQGIEKILAGEGVTTHVYWQAVKLFERDEKVSARLQMSVQVTEQIEKRIAQCEEQADDEAVSLIANQRYEYIESLVKRIYHKKSAGLSVTEKIDRVVTNRWLALPIFGLVMWLIYFIAVTSLGALITDWTNNELFGKIISSSLSAWLEGVGAASWLRSLIVDGILGGVGSVLGFVPQILLLFLMISFLEDCGYMSRVAFIMDRIFRKFGLSGKSFIPMLVGTGCSVPAIMASRTIENDKDRKMTIILTPFIPCSAKLPIFAMMTSIFFPRHPWVAPSMYFLGISMVVLSGLLLKNTRPFIGDPAPFVMELPRYHLPALKNLLLHVWDRVKSFIIKAGTVIFIGSSVIWFLQSFNWQLRMVDAGQSILSSIGSLIAPLFAPLGFGSWQSSVSTLTGILAKENVVATFGVLSGPSADLTTQLSSFFTPVSAYAFMVFNLLASPCIAAVGAMRRELGSWKWTLFAMAYQTGLAYLVALMINQAGSVIFYGASPVALVILMIVLLIVFSLYLIVTRTGRQRKVSF